MFNDMYAYYQQKVLGFLLPDKLICQCSKTDKANLKKFNNRYIEQVSGEFHDSKDKGLRGSSMVPGHESFVDFRQGVMMCLPQTGFVLKCAQKLNT